LKAYTRPITSTHFAFNRTLNRTRVVIEHAFGRLKNRWRRLKDSTNVDSLRTVRLYALCACLLQNFLHRMNDVWNKRDHEEEVRDVDVVDDDGESGGEELRDRVADGLSGAAYAP